MRIRITFAKQGALRYTGHLDLHKLWERAARRAGLPLAYSQGFHPQPKIQIAAALPLGFSSHCEIVDMWLNEPGGPADLGDPLGRPYNANVLQNALPEGIQILDVATVDERAPALQTLVTSAEYEVTLLDPPPVPELTRRFASVMEAVSLPRERRGKAYDLRPLIESLEAGAGPDKDRILVRLAARQGATGRPEELLDVLGIPLEDAHIERTRLIFGQDALE